MKTFNDLTDAELKQVWENNEKFRSMVFEYAAEDADFQVGEILDCWERGGCKYELDVSGYHNYFRCTDYRKFIDGLRLAQKGFCFLSDEYNATIEKCAVLLDRLYIVECYRDYDNEQRIEKRLDELTDELEKACFDCFRGCYDDLCGDDYMWDYFTDFWIDCYGNDERFYIGDDMRVYETIVKCYV